MKRLILPLAVVIAVASFACKKEEVDNQALTQKLLIGKWPLKYRIKTVYTDNVMEKPDTLRTYNPIDTLVLTEDGNAIIQNKTVISNVGYTISAGGETLTFNTTPAVTHQITFIRNSSFGLGKETITQVGGKEVKTVEDDQYQKN